MPYIQPVFDRIMLEIMRGCTLVGAAFSQAGMSLPSRTRAERGQARRAGEEIKSRTRGYEEISLSSLSSSD